MFSNIPLLLTWLRIVLIPVFVVVYYLPDAWLGPVAKNWTAMTVFAVAAITDWLDGYLARRWGEVSAFGAFLDPVADKLMVAAALILIGTLYPLFLDALNMGKISVGPPYFNVVFLCFDFVFGFLRYSAAEYRFRIQAAGDQFDI